MTFLPNYSVLLYKTYEFAEKGSSEYRFPLGNFLTYFLPHYCVCRPREAIPQAQKGFNKLLCKLWDLFCNNYAVVWTTSFWIFKTAKTATFPVTKNISIFFLVIPSFADLQNRFIRLQKYSGKLDAGEKINSLTPKTLSKTQIFEEKATFPVKKIIWPIAAVNTEYGRSQVTN